MKICVYHIITLAVLKKKADDLTLPENAANCFGYLELLDVRNDIIT